MSLEIGYLPSTDEGTGTSPDFELVGLQEKNRLEMPRERKQRMENQAHHTWKVGAVLFNEISMVPKSRTAPPLVERKPRHSSSSTGSSRTNGEALGFC